MANTRTLSTPIFVAVLRIVRKGRAGMGDSSPRREVATEGVVVGVEMGTDKERVAE